MMGQAGRIARFVGLCLVASTLVAVPVAPAYATGQSKHIVRQAVSSITREPFVRRTAPTPTSGYPTATAATTVAPRPLRRSSLTVRKTPTTNAPKAALAASCPTYPYGSPVVMMALGDSYSAGEGLDCYDPSTDINGSNTCHRSVYAYSAGVDPANLHGFKACSGAVTANVGTLGSTNSGAAWISGTGEWNELLQAFTVPPSAKTVTLTIGGNDVGFADDLAACMSAVLTNIIGVKTTVLHLGGDCAGLLAKSNSDIAAIKQRLVATYRAVLSQMDPHATLIVGTYPRIFPQPGTYVGQPILGGNACLSGFLSVPLLGSVQIGLTSADEASIYTMQNAMNNQIRAAITDVKTTYGDPRIRLADVEAAYPTNTVSCGQGGRPTPYVNGLLFAPGSGVAHVWDCIIGGITGSGCGGGWSLNQGGFLSTASFHPTPAGQSAMTPIFEAQRGLPIPLSILPYPSRSMIVGQTVNSQLFGVGGPNPYAWTVQSGTLPPGLTLDANTGAITGVLTTAGNYTPRIALTAGPAGSLVTVTQQLSFAVANLVPPPCTIVWLKGSSAWSSSSSWLPARVPNSADVVCIDGTDTGGYWSVSDDFNIAALRLTNMIDFTISGNVTINSTAVASLLDALHIAGKLNAPQGINLPLSGVTTLSWGGLSGILWAGSIGERNA